MPSPTDRNLTALPTKTAKPTRRRQTRHFTQLDQVTQLVAARDTDPDLGFMARLLALCSLPRTNPKNRHEFKRVNGPYTLYMVAGGGNKLPYGTLPRLLLAWVCTEAVRTQSPELILGDSLSEFMRKVGIYSTSGAKHTRLRNQMRRLFGCTVSLLYEDARGEATLNAPIARLTEFWWSERQPDARSLWESKIELGEDFFNEIIRCPPSEHWRDLVLYARVLGAQTLPPAATFRGNAYFTVDLGQDGTSYNSARLNETQRVSRVITDLLDRVKTAGELADVGFAGLRLDTTISFRNFVSDGDSGIDELTWYIDSALVPALRDFEITGQGFVDMVDGGDRRVAAGRGPRMVELMMSGPRAARPGGGWPEGAPAACAASLGASSRRG